MENSIELLQLVEKYQNQLNLIRQDLDLLENYRFDKDAKNSNHFERLRLNIAIYNDFKPSDYEIVKFLFVEENKWRKDAKDGEVDNLYFSAFISTLFNNPEIIWLFFDTKNIDFDSSIGFDGEYLISVGIEKTYQYLEGVENVSKAELLEYIGEAVSSCNHMQEEIDDWKESRISYFKCYEYPIKDELYFLYATKEKDLFLEKLPEWVKQNRKWTYEYLSLFKTYAKYSGDKFLEIEAFKLIIERNDKDFLIDIYKKQLAELYIDVGEMNTAIAILKSVIDDTDNKNIIRDCVEQLCRVVIINKEKLGSTSKASFEIIKQQQKKHKHFSTKVDNLINEVRQIM